VNKDSAPEWNVWVDTGGTFTDCLAIDQHGSYHRQKILSSSALRGRIDTVVSPTKLIIQTSWAFPTDLIRGFTFRLLEKSHPKIKVVHHDAASSTIALDRPIPEKTRIGAKFEVISNEEAPILAARLITGIPADKPLSSVAIRLGTTRGTNSLLERRGAPVALFVTQGFRDLLEIGDQTRPDLFTLDIEKSPNLYRSVVEVPERLSADGSVVVPLQVERLVDEATQLTKSGVRHAAVALMHSDINPSHEREVAEFLIHHGFDHVSVSSELAPFVKILPRAETVVVDAYLHPVIDDYLTRISTSLTNGSLHIMTSAGGLMRPDAYRAKDSLLSGPAGGVVGAAFVGRRSGFNKIVAFDMGGTSTDVARFDGDLDYVFEHRVGDAHLLAPAVAIETVASGGGSICRFDRGELRVGPASAGAHPGPACYGAGGPLTVTDINLLLGRLDPGRFDIPIDIGAAKQALDKLFRSLQEQSGDDIKREPLMEGLRDIANNRMADAIRRISIRKGYDVRDYALVAFGGAGGQHACGVAERLGVHTIVIPEDASLLSALGLGHAVMERFAERQVLQPLDDIAGELAGWIQLLSDRVLSELQVDGVDKGDANIRRVVIKTRFAGQESAIDIDYDETVSLENTFESKYRAIFGYWPEGRQIEIESVRVIGSARAKDIVVAKKTNLEDPSKSKRHVPAWFGGEWRTVPAFERDDLVPGVTIEGPALVFERYSVTAIEPGWTARMDNARALVVRQSRSTESRREQPEVIRIELFTHRFEAIAQDMGEMLRRTALSTNVKERMDFSCAVLDRNGMLVANAPHIPVHLGAIGMCVRGVIDALHLGPGDIAVTNHPAFGGSHLPDITVVMPVHLENGELLAYVANRAHHAEIGGIKPGSMPTSAASLAEEGVVIAPTLLFENGGARWNKIHDQLAAPPFASRATDENLADLNAAVAAVRKGAAALQALAEEHGADTVHHYMEALGERAAAKVRAALNEIPDDTYEATEHLDDGSALHARIEIKGDRAIIDFEGSAGVHAGNLNMTPAVVSSAVVYVLRLLVNEPLPLNEGLLDPIDLRIPEGILSPIFDKDPLRSPPVFGGNVETSQRLVDTFLKALALAACSQGTMNNIVFGTDCYSYFETVCGGAGATPACNGASAVHTHMTNTRITDPEILERRYPVRLERFEIRRDSGGKGKNSGGDGAVREITFLEPMSLSVLGQHRQEGPYGLQGGASGMPAEQVIARPNGETIELQSADTREVEPGDRLLLETPGGGGYGQSQ